MAYGSHCRNLQVLQNDFTAGKYIQKILENKKKFDAGQTNGARGDDKLKTYPKYLKE